MAETHGILSRNTEEPFCYKLSDVKCEVCEIL